MTPGVLEAVKAQWVATVLLELLRSGTARPDLLIDTLWQLPVEHHRQFLRTIQKDLERCA